MSSSRKGQAGAQNFLKVRGPRGGLPTGKSRGSSRRRGYLAMPSKMGEIWPLLLLLLLLFAGLGEDVLSVTVASPLSDPVGQG